MIIDTNKEKNTANLLYALSTRLSGRRGCRKVEYKVIISEDSIQFYPNVQLLPVRNRRTKDHAYPIFRNRILELYCDGRLNPKDFVLGEYIYLMNLSHTRRKWMRKIVKNSIIEYKEVKR